MGVIQYLSPAKSCDNLTPSKRQTVAASCLCWWRCHTSMDRWHS